MSTVTIDDARWWHKTGAMHVDGRGWSAWVNGYAEQPRLRRTIRFDRRTRQRTVTYSVDGIARASAAEAIEALNKPIAFSEGELDVLQHLADDIGGKELWRTHLPVLMQLREKGAADCPEKVWAITDIGRAALARDRLV